MISKITSAVLLISAVAIFLMLNSTNPSSAGPLGILVLFAAAYIFFVSLSILSIIGMINIASTIKVSFRKDIQNIEPIHPKKNIKLFQYSLALGFAPIGLIAQQSSGNVNFFGLVLIFIIEIIAFIYISKR